MPYVKNNSFLLGVNYPWRNYGYDFGSAQGDHLGVSLPAARDAIARDFERIRLSGASVVRWFLFGDGRCGLISQDEIPRAPDSVLFVDVDALLRLAERHGIRLCFPLIDYLWLQEHRGKRPAYPNEHILHFAASREAFLQNVLIPLFVRFREHPALFAWEIANEPEWAIREFHPIAEAKLHLADFRAFAIEVARAVREFGKVPVTLGSARILWTRAWTSLGLDFYQAHYYPGTESENRGGLSQQLGALQLLDKPFWLGELPARDPSHPDYSLSQALDICRRTGAFGAAVWRWTEPEAGSTDHKVGSVSTDELIKWNSSSRSFCQTV